MDREAFTRPLSINGKHYTIYDINRLGEEGIADISRLPYSIKILVENLLRKLDGKVVLEADLKNIAAWQKSYAEPVEIPYHPARVLMQDFTGVPAVVDLAAMRDAVKSFGGRSEESESPGAGGTDCGPLGAGGLPRDDGCASQKRGPRVSAQFRTL